MSEKKFLAVEDGSPIKFSELAHLIATALHPDDTDGLDYGVARINLNDELVKDAKNGRLVVRNPAGMGQLTLVVGASLQGSVVLQHDLQFWLAGRDVELRFIPQGNGPTSWTLANAAAAIAEQEGWHNGARGSLLDRMVDAARVGRLVVRDPHTDLPYRPSTVRTFYELVTPTDVNAWLKTQGVAYRWSIAQPEQLVSSVGTAIQSQQRHRENKIPAPLCVGGSETRLTKWLKRETWTPDEAALLAYGFDPDTFTGNYMGQGKKAVTGLCGGAFIGNGVFSDAEQLAKDWRRRVKGNEKVIPSEFVGWCLERSNADWLREVRLPPERTYMALVHAANLLARRTWPPENLALALRKVLAEGWVVRELTAAEMSRQGTGADKVIYNEADALGIMQLKEQLEQQKKIDALLSLGKLPLYEWPSHIPTDDPTDAWVNEAELIGLLMKGEHLGTPETANSDTVPVHGSPESTGNEVTDYSVLAMRRQLIDAFGIFSGMDNSWFNNCADSPALKKARKVTGIGSRGHYNEPLFCPYEVMIWLIDPKRKKGTPLSIEKGWALLQRNFPKAYNNRSIGDPRQPD